MKIGIISDTHIEGNSECIPKDVYNIFEDVDFIFHAGDIIDMGVINDLSCIAPIYAVYGNNDKSYVRHSLTQNRIIRVNNFKIGLTHGHSGKGNNTIDRAINSFVGENVDCIVFGHSHIPYNEVHDGILLFNPGSATRKRTQPKYSVGILHINNIIKGEIITF